MKKNSRIFVAGHTGLIGSAMLRKLQKHDTSDVVTRTHAQLDLTDKSAVDHFFEQVKPEFVVLAAGRVGGIVENQTYPADFMNANLAIQLNVIQAAWRHDVKKFILFGSSCMYPRECQQPMPEELMLTGKPEPTSLAYAISKLAGVQMCAAYNQQFGAGRFISVIPNSAYGPHDNFNPNSGHVLSALIRRFHAAKEESAKTITLWGSGSPRREFIHADDIASACLHLLEIDTSELMLPINVGTGRDYSIRELADLISGIIGFNGVIEWDKSKPDGAPAKLLDSSRMLALGWCPEVSFESGIKETYKWYLENIVPQGASV
jgi:GDP-L-fucose synthase